MHFDRRIFYKHECKLDETPQNARSKHFPEFLVVFEFSTEIAFQTENIFHNQESKSYFPLL